MPFVWGYSWNVENLGYKLLIKSIHQNDIHLSNEEKILIVND
jgi:hypothetical protein